MEPEGTEKIISDDSNREEMRSTVAALPAGLVATPLAPPMYKQDRRANVGLVWTENAVADAAAVSTKRTDRIMIVVMGVDILEVVVVVVVTVLEVIVEYTRCLCVCRCVK